ncbi:winged helix-turn-helix transcriptional regulator [uncultured Sphingomonas sp.]|uniref:winged helix-turn-helix transcriptional regulator n=1 Tax=uncultured Sphingomonas sp. TaxID=158754 RepID=UPI0035CAAA1F
MNTPEPVCGLDVALAVMGGKWKPLILYHLQGGPRRFGELKRRVMGISEKVLIQQLRELVAAGVLTRRDHQRVPPMVDYTMTPFGLTLAAALMPLCVWGSEHRAEVERAVNSPSSGDQTGAGPVEQALS